MVNYREEVLPLLLTLGKPQSTFPVYSTVFHEVSLLILLLVLPLNPLLGLRPIPPRNLLFPR